MIRTIEGDHARRKLVVAGAGAIGLTLAARLGLSRQDVHLIARGSSLDTIRRDGIRLIDMEGLHHVAIKTTSAEDGDAAEFLFLCSKSQDLPALAASVAHLVTPATAVVRVINGMPWWYFERLAGSWEGMQIRSVDPAGVLKACIPSHNIIGTTTMVTAERKEPGVALTFNPLQMTLGENNDILSERVDQLGSILEGAGFNVSKTARIRDAVWTKVVRNLISNPVTAITGATLRQNFGDAHLVAISRQMLDEALPLIAAYESRVEVEPAQIIESGRRLGDVKTSMLQDLERGNELELASICDAVLELADLRGIPMPVTRAVSDLAHFKSNRSAGVVAA
ncbi:ketopantoate reductase family protein [Rhizobium sp. WYJ-E13]|uniref:ketopantoate reductase family protein n=1 Tax=Rhizobium sp. WYJ-E13 TaxID=2849093 RepID=UPI001C1EBBBD|nr:2-dehydropantoate 2-reductase [Rhizobium sp. WYJ-E13]QWW72573.1 2-dehydropantoate 2-reductase [Rhizobium sp. WYJ-E13]